MDIALSPPLLAESEAVLARHARSFSLAALFLPLAARQEAAVLYHLCRLIDDLADEAPDAARARVDLDAVEAELRGEAPARPVVAAARALLVGRGVGVGPALELVRGVRGDLDPVLVDDDAELLRYCYRVAGTVGLMMTGVLGVQAPEARARALDLGIAMQLTNICRDVLEDAGRGRVYLPRQRLARRGVLPAQLLAGEADRGQVAAVVLELIALAERYYASGDEGMRYIPLRRRVAILVASRIYRAIGLTLRARGGDALAGRTRVGAGAKALWCVAALVRLPLLALRRPRSHDPALHAALAGLPGAHHP